MKEDEQLKIKGFFSDLKTKQAKSSDKMVSNDIGKTSFKRCSEETIFDCELHKKRKLDEIVTQENNQKADIDTNNIENDKKIREISILNSGEVSIAIKNFENDDKIVSQEIYNNIEDEHSYLESEKIPNEIKNLENDRMKIYNENSNKSETDNLISNNYNEYEIDFSKSNSTKCVQCKKSKSSIPKVSLDIHN